MAVPGEIDTLVFYDIEDDKIRNRIAETCKDYGLERIQYSAFFGSLSRNRREQLFLKLKTELDDQSGKLWVQPVCAKDLKQARRLEQVAKSAEPHSSESE